MIAPADPQSLARVYHFVRLQLPQVVLSRPRIVAHLERTFALYAAKPNPTPVTWPTYLQSLYTLDWGVTIGCLEGQSAAWELLFLARTGRQDSLLIDALRARAARLYPRNDEKQETAVQEFWGMLIVADTEGSVPTLARYDGQRPLAPWLIRVFQNQHLTRLRRSGGTVALPDDDLAMPLPPLNKEDARWHDRFISAARDWLDGLPEQELLILGLRWRYKLSQREVANLFGVHEGTISRQTDKLRDKALEAIGSQLVSEGWSGDDLDTFILTEIGSVLTDDPRLSSDALRRTLTAKGKTLPPERP